MSETDQEKYYRQQEAADKTEYEHRRINSYLKLRYSFQYETTDEWIDELYDQRKAVYHPNSNPSRNQVRKGAGIGFWESISPFKSKEKKKELETKRAEVRKQLQAEVDAANKAELERCKEYNKELNKRLQEKYQRFITGNVKDVEEYFTYALNKDVYQFNGSATCRPNFKLTYSPINKRIVIEYNLPTMNMISQVKGWKVDKNNELQPIQMGKMDYLIMYERILCDLSMRTVGILFKSDTNNVLDSIVFNGSCIYNKWQDKPTVLISFLMFKKQYSYDRAGKMDFISKREIANLEEVRYLGEIDSEKPPMALYDTPPLELVVPIESNF